MFKTSVATQQACTEIHYMDVSDTASALTRGDHMNVAQNAP